MPQTTTMTQNAKPHTVSLPTLDKLCVAIQGDTAEELLCRAEEVARTASFLEFRLDSLPQPRSALVGLQQFFLCHSAVVGVGTCRRTHGHGAFTGSLAEELEVLLAAAQAGCRLVDLEIESAEEAGREQVAAFQEKIHAAGAALLVSFHDFSATEDLPRAYARILAFAPDVVKVVSTARSLSDNLAVLQQLEEHSGSRSVVGIAMGEEGLLSRVLGPRFGACFTFAAPDQCEGTAPGQVTVRILRELYRVDKIDRETRILGVAGNPIGHSLSPLMHNAAYAAEGVNAVMLPLKVEALEDLLRVMRELPMAGMAVTMPLKQQVLPALAEADPLVERIGACNTLRTMADGRLQGFNTDVAGVVRPLERRLTLKGARIAVLGAGGAARAAVFGLVEQGAQVFVVNRTHATAVALAQAAGAEAIPQSELKTQRFDALLNTTPCGMHGMEQKLSIAEDELNAALVFDMIYNPLETPLLKLARTRGLETIRGVEMFVQQGARQYEIWTGKPAPEAEMRRVVEQALTKRS
jgi:3-dehydroquinate dehydratase/shikimate dehydrogenase